MDNGINWVAFRSGLILIATMEEEAVRGRRIVREKYAQIRVDFQSISNPINCSPLNMYLLAPSGALVVIMV